MDHDTKDRKDFKAGWLTGRSAVCRRTLKGNIRHWTGTKEHH